MAFKVLLRSNSKELSAELSALFEEQPYNLIGLEALNWLDSESVAASLQQLSPNIVINFSIPQSAEHAENEKLALTNIESYCRDKNLALLHFSSYRVFGRAAPDGEIREDTPPKPRDHYGKALLALEKIAEQSEKAMILRVSWLFDSGVDSLLNAIVPKLIAREPFFVSDHDFGAPLNNRFLANLLLASVQQILCGSDNWGVFHLRSSDSCSEAELCDSLVRMLSSLTDSELDLPLIAGKGDDRRIFSGNALLTGERVTNNFGIQLQSWRKGLKALLRNYLENSESLLR